MSACAENMALQYSIVALVADTFDVTAVSISTATQPGEIGGWDSLGHSVLLTRVARKFRLQLSESLVAPVESVGELVARVGREMGEVANG
jgi:acyl carrier protein